MKRTNWVRAAYDAFLLRVLQVDFGCAALFNTSNEAYLWPSIVICRCHLASFAEAHYYIQIGDAIFNLALS